MKFVITIAMFITLLATGGEDKVKQTLDRKMVALTNKYFELRRNLLQQAIKEYEALKVAETKKGNLEGALKYREQIRALEEQATALTTAIAANKEPATITPAPAAPTKRSPAFTGPNPMKKSSWKTPRGGAVSTEKDELVFQTKRAGDPPWIVATLQQKLGENYTITGEIMMIGQHGGAGFVFNYDDKTDKCCILINGNTDIHFFTYTGQQRSLLRHFRNIAFPADQWVKFRIKTQGAKIEMQMGERQVVLVLPAAVQAGHKWGLCAHPGYAITKVRDIKVTEE